MVEFIKKNILIIWTLLYFTGCATMMSGPVDIIKVSGSNETVKSVSVNGVPFNQLPLESYVSLEEDVSLEILKKDGSLSHLRIKRSINPWIFLNVFNLFLGIAVDYSNGSFWKISETEIKLVR